MNNFYIKNNIIGYTGNKHDLPTVYFREEVVIGVIKSGHITQNHSEVDNIGRTSVLISSFYDIKNIKNDFIPDPIPFIWNSIIAHEYLRDLQWSSDMPCEMTDISLVIIEHFSRSRFRKVSDGNRKTLALAIAKNPNKKLKKLIFIEPD